MPRPQAFNAQIDAKVAELEREGPVAHRRPSPRACSNDRLAKLPEPIRDDTRQALAVEPGRRTEVQKYLAAKFASDLRPPDNKLPALLDATYPEYKAQAAGIAVDDRRRASRRSGHSPRSAPFTTCRVT